MSLEQISMSKPELINELILIGEYLNSNDPELVQIGNNKLFFLIKILYIGE